mmetsp:Transcript_635/g.1532  ORF Transcript_635/g.1532 Transcript_635/m.1532 type:complete len:210 (-) Transcript_635:117-746(-)
MSLLPERKPPNSASPLHPSPQWMSPEQSAFQRKRMMHVQIVDAAESPVLHEIRLQPSSFSGVLSDPRQDFGNWIPHFASTPHWRLRQQRPRGAVLEIPGLRLQVQAQDPEAPEAPEAPCSVGRPVVPALRQRVRRRPGRWQSARCLLGRVSPPASHAAGESSQDRFSCQAPALDLARTQTGLMGPWHRLRPAEWEEPEVSLVSRPGDKS